MSKPTTRSTKADLRMYLARAERDFAREAAAHKQTAERALEAQAHNQRLHREVVVLREAKQKILVRLQERDGQRQRALIAENALRERATERLRLLEQLQDVRCQLYHDRNSRWYNRLSRWWKHYRPGYLQW